VWQYWIHTGDRPLLTTLYPVVLKVSDFFWHNVGANGLVGKIPGPTDVPQFPTDSQLNLLAVNVFHRVADIAVALGRPESEVAQQRRRADRLAAAINAHLLLPAGYYTDGLDTRGGPVPPSDTLCTCSGAVSPQVNNALALLYGIVPRSDVTTVTNYILSMPFAPPVVSATDVLDALRITGRDRDILRILTDASEPGWANILAQGGTFTWEMWKPDDRDVLTPPLASLLGNGDSRSHGFGSNVLVAIQETMLGVIPTGPGYASFDVTVPLHALSYATGQVPTPHGTIDVAWNRPARTSQTFDINVTVPTNSQATIRIPATALSRLRESGSALGNAAGVKSAAMDGDYAAVTVGSGSYHFVSAAPPA
jgi:alpha-L-rhamnosidase